MRPKPELRDRVRENHSTADEVTDPKVIGLTEISFYIWAAPSENVTSSING